MEIALNKCFGGFRFSDEALNYMVEEFGVPLFSSWEDHASNWDKESLYVIKNPNPVLGMYSNVDDYGKRTHPSVLGTIEALGEKVNSGVSNIHIIEIPDDMEYEIEEYGGIETVHAKHRSWS